MKFPLPNVSEEDRGLLKGIRSKRKYEKRRTSPKEEDGNAYCMVTVTAIGGAIIIITTIIFTVMEILNSRKTSITAYPVNYHSDDSLNILQKDMDYAYPRISLEEVRAEIEKSRKKEIEQATEMTDKAMQRQQSWIAHDFPSDVDPNTIQDIISTFFSDTEFYRRFREEGDTEWTLQLSKSRAIYNDSQYHRLPICLQMVNQANGYGYRNWRDGQVYYMADMLSCTIGIHWGWLASCPSPTDGLKYMYNIFEVLYYNNYDFAASHVSSNAVSNTQLYPPLHSFNSYLAGKGHVMYDFFGKYFNGSQTILDHANQHVLVGLANGHLDWPQKAAKYDVDLHEIGQVEMFDGDIDKRYGELIGWDGAIYIAPVLKYYGLLVQHLRYKYRKIIVDFIENNWKDKFVIAYHIQTGNVRDNFSDFIVEIIESLKFLLRNENGVVSANSIGGKNIVVYISTDAGNGNELQTFLDAIKEKIIVIGDNINVLLRDEERIEFGSGHPMATHYQTDTQEKCIELFANVQIDAELLGLVDILVLPTLKKYGSAYTRLSRALMMKRHKIICVFTSKIQYSCKNFESKIDKTMTL